MAKHNNGETLFGNDFVNAEVVAIPVTMGEALDLRLALDLAAGHWERLASEDETEDGADTCRRIADGYRVLWHRVYNVMQGETLRQRNR